MEEFVLSVLPFKKRLLLFYQARSQYCNSAICMLGIHFMYELHTYERKILRKFKCVQINFGGETQDLSPYHSIIIIILKAVSKTCSSSHGHLCKYESALSVYRLVAIQTEHRAVVSSTQKTYWLLRLAVTLWYPKRTRLVSRLA